MNIMKLITDSRLAFVGVIFGPIVGLFYKDLAQNCQYANDIYLMLMQLAVIPFMITTIVMGVLELIYNADAKKGVYNIISKVFVVLCLVCFVSIAVSYTIKPWNSMLSNTEILRVVYRTEAIIQPHAIGVNEIIDISAQKSSIGELIKSAIPSNIFKALSTGNVLQVIIFFIALGVALGYATVNTPNAAIVRKQLVGIFKVFKSINDWVLQFLPLMSFFILAYQSQFLSIDTLFVLVNLAFCITASLSVIIIISMLIIWKRSGQPLMFALREMSSCLSLAFFSRSTLVSSSLAMEVLIDKFKFHPGTIQLVVPLGASMLRFGTISIFCIATILAAHLFSADLGLYDYILLSILSVVASLVALSANNPVDNYKALSVVFTPLGLPSGAVNSIFIALDFISDAFDTMANLMGICLVAALCSPKPEKVVDTTITS